MADVWIKNVGEAKQKGKIVPRLYFDNERILRAGFSPGLAYEVDVQSDKVILSLNNDGSYTVSRKKKNDREIPVIDLASIKVLGIFEGMESVRIITLKDKIVILPLASEIAKKERLGRLMRRLIDGEPLRAGSLSHGGGVLSHAIHTGFAKAGVPISLAFANEIREDMMLHAILHNDIWNPHTNALNMPMQELVQDEWVMSQIPKLEVMEMGLPCQGASKAGAVKNKLTKAEDHTHFGHLIFAALTIIAKAQPAAIFFENVTEYADAASAQIMRLQLRDMGYNTKEIILRGHDHGCLEGRVRWVMVALTKGLEFNLEDLVPEGQEVVYVRDMLEHIPADSPRWKPYTYLKEKEVRDAAKGSSFSMQFISRDSTKIPLLRKGYHKGGSTDPLLVSEENPELFRLLTGVEHGRAMSIPEQLLGDESVSDTMKHEVAGQSVNHLPFVRLAERVAREILQSVETIMQVNVRPMMPGKEAPAIEDRAAYAVLQKVAPGDPEPSSDPAPTQVKETPKPVEHEVIYGDLFSGMGM